MDSNLWADGSSRASCLVVRIILVPEPGGGIGGTRRVPSFLLRNPGWEDRTSAMLPVVTISGVSTVAVLASENEDSGLG